MGIEIKNDVYKGISIPTSKVIVGEVTISEDRASIFTVVKWFAEGSSESYKQNSYYIPYDISGANPIEQAYTYLATLPEFQ